MNNYKNQKVTIMGLGRIERGAGVSAALFFAKQKAKVIVTDLNAKTKLNPNSLKKLKKYKNIKLVLGKHREQDFKNADLIVRNPAVKPDSKYLKIARINKVKTTTDLEIYFDNIKNKKIKTIGITGTRGKSTATTLVYEILKSKYKTKIYLGGNIGTSPLNFVNKLKAGDIVVMEIASFQLNSIRNQHFNIAAITNIMPDHMDYYATLASYKADKFKIIKNQTKQNYLFLNKQDKSLKTISKKAKSKVKYYSTTKKVKLENIKLLGKHNLSHIELAWQIGKLFKISDKQIKKVVANFKGVANRLEFIREKNQIKFYNDTTSTHPAATVVALNSLPKNKIILISGGNSKNLSLTEMKKQINDRVKHLILYPGNANKDLPLGIKIKTINQAVKKAWQLAKPNDVILFSPGLTWLPTINEFKRGEIFVQQVKRI